MPTHTIRVTPASAARARVAANRSACGSTGPSPAGEAELVLEVAVRVEPLEHGVAHGPRQSLRRGKSGAPFSTASPPG